MSKIGAYQGQDVHEVHLRGDGIEATVMTFGAALRSVQVDVAGTKRHVILGFPNFDDHVKNKSWHYGAVPGRFANRIDHGKFTLEGKDYSIPLNENGRQVCHGGKEGFGFKVWTVLEQSDDSVTLGYESKDGEEGFPGNLSAKVTYTLVKDALKIHWSATTDQSTLVNLTTHAFFNLNAGGDTLQHKLQFEADHYTPVNDELIPTGEIAPVAGTPFDFTQSRPIQFDVEGKPFHYDHNIALRGANGQLQRGAQLVSPSGDLTMEVWTDQPGIQFFDSAPMDVAEPGHDGMKLSSRTGVCLEPQGFPDAIHHDHFPNSVLKPGEEYHNHSEFRFIK
ncbi:hypothetical protein IAU60_004912 [Kwoniella sp. DSM 27419]